MKVKENRVRRFLDKLGYKEFATGPSANLARNITYALRMNADSYEPEDKREKDLYDSLVSVADKQGTIEIVPDEENTTTEENKVVNDTAVVESNEVTVEITAKPAAKKRSRGAKAKSDTNGAATAAREKPRRGRKEKPEGKKKAVKKDMPLDKFGFPEGSFAARVNAVLTRKFKKMKQIVEEAGLTNTAYDHLNKLVKKGIVERSDEGYRLAK